MRFYRVHYWTTEDGSAGFEFFASKAEAEKAIREWDRKNSAKAEMMDPVDVEPTQDDILAALNFCASHADNG